MLKIGNTLKRERKIPMQIMTFPLNLDTDLGIRMTEIRKIESLKTPPPGNAEKDFFLPYEWFALPPPEIFSDYKAISFSSFREALLLVPRIGRILRLADPLENGTPHPGLPFLSRHRTVEGPDAWVIDVPLLEQHFSGEDPGPLNGRPTQTPTPQESDEAGADLFRQVGQTARDIQRVLSLSGSMVDSLRFMEGKLPETSHGLEVISQMTEDAAHKLMGTLETLAAEHDEIRKNLQDLSRNPSTMDEKISRISATLDQADQRIMAGFEAMAFQDLVGQNIKLIGSHLKELESRLVRILIETSPDLAEKKEPDGKNRKQKQDSETISLKGVKADGDIDQNSVDQLLSEFGF